MSGDDWQKGFLGKFNVHHRKQLLAMAGSLRHPAGAFILHQGARAVNFYVLKSGHVSIEIAVPPRGRVIVMRVDPGEAFGWSALSESAIETASARALDDVEMLSLPGAELKAQCSKDPNLAADLYKNVFEVVSNCLAACRLHAVDMFAGERLEAASQSGSA